MGAKKREGRTEAERRETNKKWFIAELAMTSQVACLSLCHVGHLWSCCVTPSHPGRLLWGINTPMGYWCICTSGLCYQVPLGSYWKNQGLHGSHCFGPRHGSCCSFDSGRCNDSHVKAGTSVVGSEVTKWRLELYNCHWATLPSNLGKWVPRDRQGQMHMWGWAYTALGIKGTTFPLKLVMISGVVLRPCVNNLLPNYLSCSDCSTIWLSLLWQLCKLRGLARLIATRI